MPFLLLKCFLETRFIIRVFGSPDQLSSFIGAEIMAHKLKIGYKFKSHKR